MKIALLAYDECQALFLRGTKEKLIEQGYDATLFYETNFQGFENEERLNWVSQFDVDRLLSFDRLVVFNGYAKESTLQTNILKGHLGNRMFFCERGWLPQKDMIYFDKKGLGGRSSLAQRDLSEVIPGVYYGKVITPMRSEYKHKNYILIPQQLEHDTSITLDSKYVKHFNSLIRFVAKTFPNELIITRPHPLQSSVEITNLDNVITEFTHSTYELAAHAKAIIGVNSTVMIESLHHGKPMVFFGDGVLDGSGIYSKYKLGDCLKRLIDYTPNRDKIRRCLSNLRAIQTNIHNPNIYPIIKDLELV